jgi:hypothetical protein
MKTFVSAISLLIAAFGTRSFAQPLNITAKFGFLGEYDLSAAVTSETSGGERTFAGPMTIRHVGLCSHNGPDESRGEFVVRFVEGGSQISAAFAFEGQQCTYKGKVSQENIGELICSATIIPFSIWFAR